MAGEVAHSTSVLILLAAAVHMGIRGLWLDAALLPVANLALNRVPIGVLRYDRLRLQARLARRRAAHPIKSE